MEAARVLHRLRERGVHLRAEGEAIVAAPRDALDDELRALIRQHKRALLTALKPAPEALGAAAEALQMAQEFERTDPREPAREQRRQKAVQMLRQMPTRRSAFIAGEPVEAGIPVMVAVRTVGHGIVMGELTIPKERWSPASFLFFLDEMDQRAAS